MLLRIALTQDIQRWAERKQQAVERGAMAGARRFRTRLKLALRDDVRRSGLGDRVANAWRDEVYPKGGKLSMRPTVFAWSKAPEIMHGHSGGKTITAGGGKFLAIPTRDVPLKRAGRPLTVEECQDRFGKRLVFVPGSSGGRYGAARGGVALMVLKDLKIRRSSGRWRNASKKEKARGASHDVVMFILVRQVSLRARLNWQRIGDDLGRAWRDYVGEETIRALKAS